MQQTHPTYRVLPLMTRLAFRTTRPLQAFFKAFGVVYANGADMLSAWEMHDVLEGILREHVEGFLGVVTSADLTMGTSELSDPPGVVQDDALETFLEHGRQLPVSPLTDLHLRDSGAITRILAAPWEHFPRRGEIGTDTLTYLPPGIVIRLAGQGFPVRSTVLSISPLLDRTPFPFLPGTTYREWFVEVLRSRAVWKAIAAGASGAHPLCPHTTCRVHATGLCHGWFPVPRQEADCNFRSFLRSTTKHDVSADGLQLVPAVT